MPSTYTSLRYHIVFSTKNRAILIEAAWRQRLYDYFGGCFRELNGVLLKAGGTADHIHLFAGLRATHCIADVVRDVKRATSSWVHDNFANDFKWQEGYAAFTVSSNDCGGLVRYIQSQEEHHRVKSFAEELKELLRMHGIDFDERYLL